jgi:hypothetical protein
VSAYRNWTTSPSELIKDETLAFESQLLRDAHQEWMRQAAGHIPARHQFTPRSVKAFAANLMIFERRADTYFIRLMGTRVADVLGEMQGKSVAHAVPPEVAQSWTRSFDAVIASAAPLRIVKTVSVNDLHHLEAEIFLAPLLDVHGALTMVFSVITFRCGVAPSQELSHTIASNDLGGESRDG